MTSRAGDEYLAAKKFDGYSVKLIRIDPYPKTERKIELSDYAVTFVVSKENLE